MRIGVSEFPKRGEIYWVSLDPTIGSEINKTRPALVVSNDIGNDISKRIIIAPVTSAVKQIYPFEVGIIIDTKTCKVLLDQVRCIDKIRLRNKVMSLDRETMQQVDRALKIALALEY
jgi:mRNA interferase MazF